MADVSMKKRSLGYYKTHTKDQRYLGLMFLFLEHQEHRFGFSVGIPTNFSYIYTFRALNVALYYIYQAQPSSELWSMHRMLFSIDNCIIS